MSSPRNHTYSKRSKPPSAHHGAYWWCEQTNLGLFAEPYDRVPLLHSIRFGIQHLSLTQPHFLAGLRSQLQATGITDTLIPHVQEINGGDSKDEIPVTSAAIAMSKGEASDHTRGPSCYQESAQSCLQLHVCSITVQHPEVQPPLEFGMAPLAAGLAALTRLIHPVCVFV